jgi:hypothetical protein
LCSSRRQGLAKDRVYEVHQLKLIAVHDEVRRTNGVVVVHDSLFVVEINARFACDLQEESWSLDAAACIAHTHRMVARGRLFEVGRVRLQAERVADDNAVYDEDAERASPGVVSGVIVGFCGRRRIGLGNKRDKGLGNETHWMSMRWCKSQHRIWRAVSVHLS